MRASATQIESYRLYMTGDWMPEEELIASLSGVFVPNHEINLGSVFGRILEDPDRYRVAGGYCGGINGETFEFGADVMDPCLAAFPKGGVYEAKTVKSYGAIDVASRADYVLGADLYEFKTTLSTYDPTKYLDSCQWRLMADAFQPRRVTYLIFCLSEAANGVISLRSIERLPLYPYARLHEDCAELVTEFGLYVKARGLDGVLHQRKVEAA